VASSESWQVLDKQRRAPSRVRSLLIFLMHQLIGTWGVALLATILASSMLDSLRFMGWRYPLDLLHRALAYRPYFPVQIALGLYSGWLLRRRQEHRSMVWVWIIPLLVLCYAVASVPTLTPSFTSVMIQAGVNQSRFSHYFGWGCQPRNGCFDQTLVTMPFYAATAYSIGAWLATKSTKTRAGTG
jgi:hypothetical protein